jgi:putative FmdB family regulatory protein
MPLYEYQCETCSHRFEKIQKFSDPPPDKCPKCGGPVRKLFSSPAIQFKGSGFYITDYAKKSAADGGESASSEKKEKEKSDTKSEKTDAGSTKTDSGSAKTDSGSAKTETGGKADSGGSSSGGPAPASTTKE